MAAFIRAQGLTPVLTNSLYHDVLEPRPETRTVTWPHSTDTLLTRVQSGARLTPEQAIELADHVPFHVLGQLAHQRRCSRVGSEHGTFTIDRNISFTNVCIVKCKFCAFCCNPGDARAFVMDLDEIVSRVQEAKDLGATQIMLQGGLNPDLDLAWYEGLLRTIKTHCPDLWLHSLSPAEILWLSQQAHLSLSETILRLQAAGLDSLPGGGAEILVDDIRNQVSPAKLSTDEWFTVIRMAQTLGLSTTATMVYGFGETTAQRVEHLMRVRDLQDETGGFRAFIPWSFQSNKTQWSAPAQTGVDYLRVVALARLVLDNVSHIQSGWVTEGPDLAQLALRFGADDMGGVLMEESVVSATGLDFGMSVQQMKRLIRGAGFVPAQRNTLYDMIRTFDQDPDVVSSEASCS
ncbi:MAG: dehypoxanthine futalosine cyclase [Phycisphaeraceae bacterium]|nr:dehypoxanthine futalosine cyclase [Phycisphaeraceae bacterium]